MVQAKIGIHQVFRTIAPAEIFVHFFPDTDAFFVMRNVLWTLFRNDVVSPVECLEGVTCKMYPVDAPGIFGIAPVNQRFVGGRDDYVLIGI